MKRAILLIAAALTSIGAHATEQLAFDLGCYNCHGTPPQAGGPTFAELARRYERLRGDAKAQQQIATKLRSSGHVNAHTQLSEASAAALIRWLSEGAQAN